MIGPSSSISMAPSSQSRSQISCCQRGLSTLGGLPGCSRAGLLFWSAKKRAHSCFEHVVGQKRCHSCRRYTRPEKTADQHRRSWAWKHEVGDMFEMCLSCPILQCHFQARKMWLLMRCKQDFLHGVRSRSWENHHLQDALGRFALLAQAHCYAIYGCWPNAQSGAVQDPAT